MKSKSGIPFNLLVISEEGEGLGLVSKVLGESDVEITCINSFRDYGGFDQKTFFLIIYIPDNKTGNNISEEILQLSNLQIPVLIITGESSLHSVLSEDAINEFVDFIDLSASEKLLSNRIKVYKDLFKGKYDLLQASIEIDNKKKRVSEEDQKFKIITSTILKPVVFVDQDLNITFWNNDAQNLLGYTRFEIANENFLRWTVAPSSHELIINLFKDVAAEGARKIKRSYQFWVKTKLKVELEIDATISYLKAGENGFNLIFVFHDYSKERRLEKETQKVRELSEENKLLHEFAHHISHELRTPLNAIMGISKTLMKYNANNLIDKQKEGLDIIYKCGNQLIEMISDLLNISRMDSNRLKLNEDLFNFDKFLSLQKSQILQLIENKPIKLLIKKSPSIPVELKADSRKIGQILTNLLSNSVKFTEKGKIILSCHLVENKLFFEIVDTGIGIPSPQLKTIFEKFRQVDESVFNTMGAGLGLHIAKKLVDLMHGEITAESEEGKGTIVRFYVTLSETVPVVKIPSEGNSETADLKFIRYNVNTRLVLLIDDSIQNLFQYSIITEQTDYSAILCKTGKVGLNSILEYLPDLILLKLEIPGLHGTSIIRELEKRNINIPILALSEYETPAFILPPHVKFLPGPVNAEQILEILNDLAVKDIKPKAGKLVVFESQSWLQDEKILVEDTIFIDNKYPEQTYIQIFRKNCDCLIFEQTDKNNFSLELFLKVLSEGNSSMFKEIIVQYDGVPMKYISQKIEDFTNIRLVRKEEILKLFLKY